MNPDNDHSRNLLIGILAKRLGYTHANATAVAEILSEDDRGDVIAASQTCEHGGTVAIAAIVMRSRQRQIQAMPPGRFRDMARNLATAEADQLRRVIDSLPMPELSRAR